MGGMVANRMLPQPSGCAQRDLKVVATLTLASGSGKFGG